MSKFIIWLIRIYQIGISPILGHRCRFSVTCSQYGINSIRSLGLIKGIWKTCLRILQCHPVIIRNFDFFRYINVKNVVNMDLQKNFFVIAFLIVSCILWQTWDTEFQHFVSNFHQIESDNLKNVSVLPKNFDIQSQKDFVLTDHNHIITVKTDVFFLKINMYGGDIEEAYLTNYLENLDSKKPLLLLNSSKEFIYQVNSGLINVSSLKDCNNKKKLVFTNIVNQNDYILSEDKNELQLTLVYQDYNFVYTKRYVFHRNDYAIYVSHIIENKNIYPLTIKLFGTLSQSVHSVLDKNSNYYYDDDGFPLYAYRGAAYSTNKEKYQKYSFKNIKNMDLNINTNGGWVAMLQKYFVTAWLPVVPKSCKFYTAYVNNDIASIGFESDLVYIPAGEKSELKSILWIGPKIQEKIRLVSSNLNLVIDYGWLWFISQPLFKLLQFIHYYVDNWGVAIILITLMIRLIMYPVTKAQYISIAKIRMLQPKLVTIQEEYKHDKYQYHQKIIELYKSEKVNPFGGCLPLFIQMPIFLALYYMLSGSIELRHSKFVLWINDLSSPDPYYILPIIMGISMFFIQKLSPTTISDPIQKKVMSIMLVIFTVFFLWFPSGLVLYYIVSNVITIVQQQIIYHGLLKTKSYM